MTIQMYDAIFQNGAFRIIAPAMSAITEGQQVRLIVELEMKQPDVLELAGEVYEGLLPDEINEVEQIALDRRRFFSNSTE